MPLCGACCSGHVRGSGTICHRSKARDTRPVDPGGVQNDACLFLDHKAASPALPHYLHDGTELRLILHLLLSNPPLDTGQDGGPEEVPPVVMQRPEKELKQLSLHIRGGALRRHTQTLRPSGSHSQPGPRAAKRPERCLLTASSGLAFHPHSRPVKPPEGQQFKRGVLRQRHGHS